MLNYNLMLNIINFNGCSYSGPEDLIRSMLEFPELNPEFKVKYE